MLKRELIVVFIYTIFADREILWFDNSVMNNDKSIKIQCPAKVNLNLKVLNKREDGFHNIESVMQTISLYDYLTVSAEDANELEINLSGNNSEIPYNEKNLVWKAIKLFFDETKLLPQKISVYIDKNIPVAAGLAGGSTDAAGMLFGLNEMFDRPLDRENLHKLCSKLGSDLNVCLQGGRIMSRGRGEIIEPLEFKEFNLSLIKPKNLGISAKEAYTKFSKKTKTPERENFQNDLEWALIEDYEELQEIKRIYPKSVMTGSGSTYFMIDGEFENQNGYQVFNNLKAVKDGVCIIE